MHMNDIEMPFPKASFYMRVKAVRNGKTIYNSFDKRTVTHDIFLFLLSLVIRREHNHLMSVRPEPVAQPFHGNRNPRDERLIVVRHHCDFHGIITPLVSSV